jgi:hypothetical protein
MTLKAAIELEKSQEPTKPTGVNHFSMQIRGKDEKKGLIGFDKAGLYISPESKEEQVPGFNQKDTFIY